MRECYSVLMSVYYRENPEYLRQAIESVQNQTLLTDDFVLICDGPLTLELDEVINKKKQELGEVLKVIRLTYNSGLGNALNEGIKYCKNELVARADSDDILCPDRCEKQVRLFTNIDDLQLLSGTLLEFIDTPLSCTGKRALPKENKEIIQFSKKRNPMNHPCVMFRKSAVEKVGGYNEEYHFFEDYHLWVRMLQSGAIAKNLQDVLLYMRASEDMYARRGGWKYAKDMLRFHWWMYKSGWSSLKDFCVGAIPHAIVCVVPNKVRKAVYSRLRK